MRLHLDLVARNGEIPWEQVLRPGRNLAYHLLAETAPDLAQQLHDVGWGRKRMVPFGYSPPVFPKAAHRKRVYSIGGRGHLELCSPLSSVIGAWNRALQHQDTIRWGVTTLELAGVRQVHPPAFSDGTARLRTTTPVVMKSSPADPPLPGEHGKRSWVLPGEAEFPAQLLQNLRNKAERLGLAPEIDLERTLQVMPLNGTGISRRYLPGELVELEQTALLVDTDLGS